MVITKFAEMAQTHTRTNKNQQRKNAAMSREHAIMCRKQQDFVQKEKMS
jgi:hypothetical protein